MNQSQGGIRMNRTTSQNLGLSIEQRSRVKLVKSAKDHLSRLKGGVKSAASRINSKRPMDLVRAVSCDDSLNGLFLNEAASNLADESQQWLKCLATIEQRANSLERAILQAELALKGTLGDSLYRALCEDETEDIDN